jgi:hypothetical protein
MFNPAENIAKIRRSSGRKFTGYEKSVKINPIGTENPRG